MSLRCSPPLSGLVTSQVLGYALLASFVPFCLHQCKSLLGTLGIQSLAMTFILDAFLIRHMTVCFDAFGNNLIIGNHP